MKMNRRKFLKKSTLTAGALAVPTIVPASVFGENVPSNRINIAAIGVGGRGSGNVWHGFVKGQPDVRVVAACDCFRSRREDFARRTNEHYGSDVCKPMADFRDVLARDDVDGVVISTQDHWHVPLAYHAAVAKKDMYVEKPLGVAMAWAWKLREVVEKNKVVFQYGTQQRSGDGFGRVVNLVRNGYIGKVKHIDAWCAGMRAPGGYANTFEQHYQDTQPAEIPDDLNYDMWIGPAPMKPYTKSRCTEWGSYFIYDYALGFIAGWGAHPLDIAQWGLDKDHTSPVYYEGSGKMPPEGLFDTIDYWDMHCKYDDDVTMRFMCTRAAQKALANIPMRQHTMPIKDHGTRFVGEKGWLCVGRWGVYGSTKELQGMKISDKDTPVYHSISQARNFVECMKSRKPTINPLESAIRSDTISHLSDISIRLNRPIKWDPKNEKIIDNDEAVKMLDRPMRKPWTM
jgi:predicted dehydrogenase